MSASPRARFAAIVTTAALALGGTLVASAPASATTVTIDDPALNQCIVDLGGLGNLLNTLTLGLLAPTLDCSGTGVLSIAGLESLGGLKSIDLSDNAISDIDLLSTLTSVGGIDLDGNSITDLSALKGVKGLLGLLKPTISAVGQSVALAPSTVGSAVVVPTIVALDGTIITPTIKVGAGLATGVVDPTTGVVTWLTAGVGELVWSVAGFAGQLTSVISDVVVPGPTAYPVPTPVVSGKAAVGQTLTADVGSGFEYQWSRANVPIGGATTSHYTVSLDDLGKTLTVVASGTLDDRPAGSAASAGFGPIVKGFIASAPIPTVVGTASVGSTLTVNPGVWSDGVTLTSQWRVDSHDIAGATGVTYTVADADLGKRISVAVTGTRDGYATLKRTSLLTAAVTAPAPTPVPSEAASVQQAPAAVVAGIPAAATSLAAFARLPVPRISGTARVGKVLRVKAGSWPKHVKLRYQWKANGKKIGSATHKKLTLATRLRGKKVTVTVTATLPGYRTATTVSNPTKKIAAKKPVAR